MRYAQPAYLKERDCMEQANHLRCDNAQQIERQGSVIVLTIKIECPRSTASRQRPASRSDNGPGWAALMTRNRIETQKMKRGSRATIKPS
jgi:hypothetical protein